MMELWHQFSADQMLRRELVLIPFGLHHLRNAPRPTGEMGEDIHEEPKLHTLEATPEECAQAELFDNKLDQVLLLVDYIQTRTRILKLVNELETLTEKLTDIVLGLKQSSMHGTC